uniref:Uncharacterized protein n=1 Tax=Populus alba TaxID=43335 RepID=A0A4U5MXY0_POPAL|nr:hypothetical protein D5086_0000298450 [Populus alba]
MAVSFFYALAVRCCRLLLSFCLVAFSSFRFLLFPSFTGFQPCLAVGVPAVKLLRKLSVVIEPSFGALTASPAPASPAVAFKVPRQPVSLIKDPDIKLRREQQ